MIREAQLDFWTRGCTVHGKELVFAAFRGETLERIPWVPFVGCHGGALIGVNAESYLKSTSHMLAGIDEAIKRYRPDGIPVTFDLQIEAEAMGCQLAWGKENPPAVATHPLAEGACLSDFHVPEIQEGRIQTLMDVATQIRSRHQGLALYGLVTGPFTLALHLLGTDLLVKMFKEKDAVVELMSFCQKVSTRMADYYMDAGCDIIALVDPMTSQIGPSHFERFVAPFVKPFFDHVRRRQLLSSFFVCGDAQHNIKAMCACGPDNISIDENIPLDYVRDVCTESRISFGGNMQLTVVLLMGSEEDAQREALRCMELGGRKGFVLAPGCDLPYHTPPKNLEAVGRLTYDPYQQDVVRTLSRQQAVEELLDLQDYGKSEKVMVDVITLDSESCAPCQYTVEVVKSAVAEFHGIVEWREHKIKEAGSVLFMKSLMVKNIPTICIDGKITFVSKIPPKEELVAAFRRRIYEKLNYRIRSKRGSVFLIGETMEECESIRPVVEQAINELGLELSVSMVTDPGERFAYGVVTTPAIIVASYKIKSEGYVPSVPIIREWLKEMG